MTPPLELLATLLTDGRRKFLSRFAYGWGLSIAACKLSLRVGEKIMKFFSNAVILSTGSAFARGVLRWISG